MRLHATVSKDGRKLRARFHPSRRVAPAGATLLSDCLVRRGSPLPAHRDVSLRGIITAAASWLAPCVACAWPAASAGARS